MIKSNNVMNHNEMEYIELFYINSNCSFCERFTYFNIIDRKGSDFEKVTVVFFFLCLSIGIFILLTTYRLHIKGLVIILMNNEREIKKKRV